MVMLFLLPMSAHIYDVEIGTGRWCVLPSILMRRLN